LSLPQLELKSPSQKQQDKKKSEVIINYSELKKYFENGVLKGWAKEEWLDYFDEN
jgi:hypothetical protein